MMKWQKKVDFLEKKANANEQSVNQSFDYIEAMQDNVEHMEDQNRRNNVKILGMEEDPDKEKLWDDTEELIQNLIKDKLGSSKSFEIERCHRVGYPGKKVNHLMIDLISISLEKVMSHALLLLDFFAGKTKKKF